MNSRQVTRGLQGREPLHQQEDEVVTASEFELNHNSNCRFSNLWKVLNSSNKYSMFWFQIRSNRAREIDVLALTERIVLIECKNYRGKVVSHNGDIIEL